MMTRRILTLFRILAIAVLSQVSFPMMASANSATAKKCDDEINRLCTPLVKSYAVLRCGVFHQSELTPACKDYFEIIHADLLARAALNQLDCDNSQSSDCHSVESNYETFKLKEDDRRQNKIGLSWTEIKKRYPTP